MLHSNASGCRKEASAVDESLLSRGAASVSMESVPELAVVSLLV